MLTIKYTPPPTNAWIIVDDKESRKLSFLAQKFHINSANGSADIRYIR
jgi:hypothetical protein